KAFDGIMEKHGVEKIKTIGDAYMAAGGLSDQGAHSIKSTVNAALDMQAFIINRKQELNKNGIPAFEMRIGIHAGPVVAGIVGVKKFQYDLWGDTVNTASRIESNGQTGKVNISKTVYDAVKDQEGYLFESRGKIAAKGKGEIEMWFVSRAALQG
ncbi:MAG: adenylate/guanylate cyclase domain-containing protein, partial [Cryomorphaceae bacterium]